MHQAALAWTERCAPESPGDVLDVGGRNINGNPRHLFPTATSYTVVDLHEAPDVDLVGDIRDLGLEGVADTVLCLEVFEHAEKWPDVVAALAVACRPNGTVIVTCAGPGRQEHSAHDGGPLRAGEWYRNVSCGELRDVMEAAGLQTVTDRFGEDTRAYGRFR